MPKQLRMKMFNTKYYQIDNNSGEWVGNKDLLGRIGLTEILYAFS